MTWKTVRLELAKTPRHPQGSPDHAYYLRLPVKEDDRVDVDQLSDPAEVPQVRHVIDGARDRLGAIGKDNGDWIISYEKGEDDDESLFHLDTHVIRMGEYLTITGDDDVARPFQIVNID